MAEISDLDVTDASNTARFPENQAPSTVNNGARALEGIIARGLKDTVDGSITTGGTTTAYTVASNRTLSAYYDGLTLTVEWNATCGVTPTVNVDSLGAKSIYWPDGTQVTTGDLVADARSIIQYDGTNFQVLTPIIPGGDASGPASATDGAYVQFDGTSGKVLKETAATVLEAGTTRTLTAGFSSDVEAIGNSGTGTQTLEVSSSKENFKTMTINGSFTLAPQAATSVILIIATNDGTGGYTITTSGYDLVSGSYNNTASAVHLFESIVIGSVQILRITEIA